MGLHVLLKRICFLFNQMIFSGLILGLLFCHVNLLLVQHLVHHMHVPLLSLLLLYVTIKTSLIVLYIVVLSVWVVTMLIKLWNLHTLLLVRLIMLQIPVNHLKSDFHLPKKISFICFNKSSLKMMKMLSISSWKIFSFSRYLNFCLDILDL